MRRRGGGQAHAKVTNIELFFDLVFVYAVTQLSHGLLADLSLQGALHTGLLFLAVWWVWIYTSWITNWLDPDRASVRLILFTMMLAALALSAELPRAFGSGGPVFALAYVGMQLGRTGFMLWAVRHERLEMRRNFQRIFGWLMIAALFWLGGAFNEGRARWWLWVAAIAIEYGSVAIAFWLPGLGRSRTTDWDIEGAHLAERCSLFIMISLGESILITGSTAAGVPATTATMSAFLAAFLGCVAMWWIYFNIGVERGAQQIASSADPGRLGRLAYTYLHLLIVAGIIVSAVADELVLAHPDGHLDAHTLPPIVAGPALFLLGNLAFKHVIWGRPPASHIGGLALLAAATACAGWLRLLLGIATTAILLLVALWETLSLRPRHAG